MQNGKLTLSEQITLIGADGNVITAVTITAHEKTLVFDDGSGPVVKKLTFYQTAEISENGATRCVVTTVEVRNGVERVNETVTTSGPC